MPCRQNPSISWPSNASRYLWTSVFDLAGNRISQMNPLGAVWSQTFDNQNRPLVATDPMGNQTQFGYDSVGNRTVVVSPMGYRTSYAYNVFDKVVSVQNALGFVTTNLNTTVFDSANRPIASVDPLGSPNHLHRSQWSHWSLDGSCPVTRQVRIRLPD